MIIREATKEDIPKILPIWRELMDFHAQRDPYYNTCEDAEAAFSKYVHENIEKEDACVFVAQIEDHIVGYCQSLIAKTPSVFALKQYGNIADMAVLESHRRQGIGEQIVARAVNWFRSRGLERMEMRAAVTNEISTKFWRKMGFKTYAETMYQSIELPK